MVTLPSQKRQQSCRLRAEAPPPPTPGHSASVRVAALRSAGDPSLTVAGDRGAAPGAPGGRRTSPSSRAPSALKRTEGVSTRAQVGRGKEALEAQRGEARVRRRLARCAAGPENSPGAPRPPPGGHGASRSGRAGALRPGGPGGALKIVCWGCRGRGGETPKITGKNPNRDLSVGRESDRRLPRQTALSEVTSRTALRAPPPPRATPRRPASRGKRRGEAGVSIRRPSDCFTLGSSFIGQY